MDGNISSSSIPRMMFPFSFYQHISRFNINQTNLHNQNGRFKTLCMEIDHHNAETDMYASLGFINKNAFCRKKI